MCGVERGVDPGYDSVASALKKASHENLSQQLHRRSKSGYQAIHYACKSGDLEMVRWLAEHGAEVSGSTGTSSYCTCKSGDWRWCVGFVLCVCVYVHVCEH